jgi:hypothetical protein
LRVRMPTARMMPPLPNSLSGDRMTGGDVTEGLRGGLQKRLASLSKQRAFRGRSAQTSEQARYRHADSHDQPKIRKNADLAANFHARCVVMAP